MPGGHRDVPWQPAAPDRQGIRHPGVALVAQGHDPDQGDVPPASCARKLSQATGGEQYIQTVWGRGYIMRGPEAATPELERLAVRRAAWGWCRPALGYTIDF